MNSLVTVKSLRTHHTEGFKVWPPQMTNMAELSYHSISSDLNPTKEEKANTL